MDWEGKVHTQGTGEYIMWACAWFEVADGCGVETGGGVWELEVRI